VAPRPLGPDRSPPRRVDVSATDRAARALVADERRQLAALCAVTHDRPGHRLNGRCAALRRRRARP
jgi:hypothetical protein